jgi:putative tryptophan/tyrosine transport system substrate-binding protein
MRRRDFIKVVAGSAVTWPLAAHAQQPANIPRIGFVYPGPTGAAALRVDPFVKGLREAGFAAPTQVEMVVRSAGGNAALIEPLVNEVLAQNVSVFVAVGPPVLQVVRKAAGAVPIATIDLESDPVASGYAVSLAHPGGNITGIFMDFPDFTAKWLELLLESSPKLSRVAILWDPVTGPVQLEAVKNAAAKMKIDVDVFQSRSASDFESTFSAASQHGDGAMIILSSPLISPNSEILADLALRYRLPAITLFPEFARAGGLLAYGPNLFELFRLLGHVSGKILQGAKPADLPIERPTKFELILNMRTAKGLGLSPATGLLLRADEVIE